MLKEVHYLGIERYDDGTYAKKYSRTGPRPVTFSPSTPAQRTLQLVLYDTDDSELTQSSWHPTWSECQTEVRQSTRRALAGATFTSASELAGLEYEWVANRSAVNCAVVDGVSDGCDLKGDDSERKSDDSCTPS